MTKTEARDTSDGEASNSDTQQSSEAESDSEEEDRSHDHRRQIARAKTFRDEMMDSDDDDKMLDRMSATALRLTKSFGPNKKTKVKQES